MKPTVVAPPRARLVRLVRDACLARSIRLGAPLAAACLLLAPSMSSAQTAAALRAGTTGFGGDIAYALSDNLGLRGHLGTGSVSRTLTDDNVDYEGRWKFGTTMALVDFFPGGGRFRLSLGAAYNGNKFEGTARGTSGTVDINGRSYNLSDIGTLTGNVSFRKFSPYFGVGWGTAAKSAGTGLFFSADLGVILAASPRASLRANCGAAFTAAQCNQLQADLRAEENDFRDSVDTRSAYPVLSFGVGYRF